jgi:hypothetical protein
MRCLIGRVEKTEYDFSAYLPDLHGCMATSNTPDETVRISEAADNRRRPRIRAISKTTSPDNIGAGGRR